MTDTSRVDPLIVAMVTQFTDLLPEVVVTDGVGVTGDPGDHLRVGCDDPYSLTPTASESNQDWATAGGDGSREETGWVNLYAEAWNGDRDQGQARGRVYAMVSRIEAHCRATPNLGVSGVLWTTVHGGDSELKQDQFTDGAWAGLGFRIGFRAYF